LRMRKKGNQVKFSAFNPPESPFEYNIVLSDFIHVQRGTRP
jgi:hypothetical protein